jgi:dihydrofolate reductase
MRKIIFQNMISIDGYFEGSNREIDWHNVDDEFNNEAIEFLNTIDTLLFGRITYELMANYWPTPAAKTDDPIIAEKMNALRKVVITKTLDKADWENTIIIKNNFIEEIKKIKGQSGKDIAIFGSSDLSVLLIENNLIDEIRIMINPIVLGNGKPLFKGIKNRLKLELIKTKTFKSGNVALFYKPIIGE